MNDKFLAPTNEHEPIATAWADLLAEEEIAAGFLPEDATGKDLIALYYSNDIDEAIDGLLEKTGGVWPITTGTVTLPEFSEQEDEAFRQAASKKWKRLVYYALR